MRSTWPATSVTGAPREECRNATTASKGAESLHCSYAKGRFTGDVPPATTFRNSTKKNLSFLAAALLHLANIILCYLWGHPSTVDTCHFHPFLRISRWPYKTSISMTNVNILRSGFTYTALRFGSGYSVILR